MHGWTIEADLLTECRVMFFLLSKMLKFLISPLTWVIILLVLALIKRGRARRNWLFLTLVITLAFTNNQLLYYAASSWDANPVKAEQLENEYDYGIVLTGMGSYSEKHQEFFFSEAADRFIQAVRLYKKGRIKKIVISGGSGKVFNQRHKESVFLKQYMLDMGVPARDILLDSLSRNTHENAKNSVALIRERKGSGALLITSALHMRRAMACFKNYGMQPDAYPVDVIIEAPESSPDYWLKPSADVLMKWEAVLNEWLGYIAYRLAGYI